jgi:hypothetical protein
MPRIDFRRFDRLLARCQEIAADPGVRPNVALVFSKKLDAPLRAFRAAHADLPGAMSRVRKARATCAAALRGFEAVHREARGVIHSFAPHIVLPPTLKSLRTDTDQRLAIQAMRKLLAEHAGEPWADALAQEVYEENALVVLQKLDQASAAATDLAGARAARVEAFRAAHTQFIAFKRVVRAVHGMHSHEYRSIHFRSVSRAKTNEEPAPVTASAPAPASVPAPVSAPVSAPAPAPGRSGPSNAGAWNVPSGGTAISYDSIASGVRGPCSTQSVEILLVPATEPPLIEAGGSGFRASAAAMAVQTSSCGAGGRMRSKDPTNFAPSACAIFLISSPVSRSVPLATRKTPFAPRGATSSAGSRCGTWMACLVALETFVGSCSCSRWWRTPQVAVATEASSPSPRTPVPPPATAATAGMTSGPAA